MSVRIEYKGNTYEFSRDRKGDGYWVAVTGRNKYMTVPVIVSNELRNQAVADGVDPKVFSKPRRAAQKSIKVRKKSSQKKRGRFAVSLSSMFKKEEEKDNSENS